MPVQFVNDVFCFIPRAVVSTTIIETCHDGYIISLECKRNERDIGQKFKFDHAEAAFDVNDHELDNMSIYMKTFACLVTFFIY